MTYLFIEIFHHLPLTSHVLPLNASIHMHSPSCQLPPLLQITFWHIFSLSRLISFIALTSSVFTSENLLHVPFSLLRPEHGVPPHECSNFSLERNTFEVPHLSGQLDHSPHNPQVQSTAKFGKQILHDNNSLFCLEINILMTAAWIAS